MWLVVAASFLSSAGMGCFSTAAHVIPVAESHAMWLLGIALKCDMLAPQGFDSQQNLSWVRRKSDSSKLYLRYISLRFESMDPGPDVGYNLANKMSVCIVHLQYSEYVLMLEAGNTLSKHEWHELSSCRRQQQRWVHRQRRLSLLNSYSIPSSKKYHVFLRRKHSLEHGSSRRVLGEGCSKLVPGFSTIWRA